DLAPSSAELSDLIVGDGKKLRQPASPLRQQLACGDDDRGRHLPLGNERARYNGLSGSWRSHKHTDVVVIDRAEGLLLLRSQFCKKFCFDGLPFSSRRTNTYPETG